MIKCGKKLINIHEFQFESSKTHLILEYLNNKGEFMEAVSINPSQPTKYNVGVGCLSQVQIVEFNKFYLSAMIEYTQNSWILADN